MHIRLTLLAAIACCLLSTNAADTAWRELPLIKDAKLNSDWAHIGFGGWAVEGNTLRTDPAAEGLGLLVYKKEKLGNCQIKVVFKTKDARSNSGVYVRIDDGVLNEIGKRREAFVRDTSGKISDESMKKVQASGERDEGPWYAVHHGYEIQIAGGGDPSHGTGAIYSLANSSAGPNLKPTDWNTMIITLDGEKISVEVNGKPASSFDASTKDLPARKIWHEPKREPKRPQSGYIGLQTHDPGDIVWYKEISVRTL